MYRFFSAAAICAAIILLTATAHARPNVLFITADDMNWDSLGVNGCKVPGVSPNIDKLASQGMTFHRAHVTIAVCQPTRAVWMTGLYPHKNGARGFDRIKPGILTLPEILDKAGYLNGLMAKNSHVIPSRAKHFHVHVQPSRLGVGRDPQLFYEHAKAFFEKAKTDGKPFFLMANSQDPHRPFAGSAQEGARRGNNNARKPNQFPQVENPLKPSDVTVPAFLPDIPPVRLEMAEYYTSVRRCDAITGQVLRALKETGYEDNTIVVFMSDHGMPLPFAKTNCYYHSTRTPWIVRWPGVVKPGGADDEHFISGIDFTPTICDALSLEAPPGVDGRSIVPLLKGQKQTRRDTLMTVFHKTAGRNDYEMRAAHNDRYLYIWNPWSNGKTVFRNESQSGRTMKAMVEAAKTDPAVAARVKLFLHRVPEELYDWREDPDCLHNLIDDPKHADAAKQMREQLAADMKRFDDPMLGTFEKR